MDDNKDIKDSKKDDKIAPLQDKLKGKQEEQAKLNEKLEKEKALSTDAQKILDQSRDKLKYKEDEIKIFQYLLDTHTKDLQTRMEDLKAIESTSYGDLETQHTELLAKLKQLEQENESLKNKITFPETTEEESKDGTPKPKVETAMTIDEACGRVKIEKDAFGHLTTKTISQIFDVLCEYGFSKYNKLIGELRKERRNAGDDTKTRFEIATKYSTMFNKLFEELQKELLEHLKITQETLFMSIESHAAKGDTHVLYLFQMLTEKMRMLKKGERFMNKEALKKVLEFKRDYLYKSLDKMRKVGEEHKEDKKYLENLFLDFTSMVYDEIHKYFGYEEEDIVKAMSDSENQYDMEVNSLLMECDSLMKQLVPVYVPPKENKEGEIKADLPEIKDGNATEAPKEETPITEKKE
jgi:hypothetical protein